MRHGFFLVIGLALILRSPERVGAAGSNHVDLTVSGDWREGEQIDQRFGLSLVDTLPGLTLRALYVERRPPDDNYTHSSAGALRAGLYHSNTGSRLLFGPLQETGLASRIRDPWGKGLPYAEHHQPRIGELSSYAGPDAPNTTYVLIGTHLKAPLRIYGAASLSESDMIIANLGLRFSGLPSILFAVEGTYLANTLDELTSSAWFSDQGPLPERLLRISGLRASLLTPTLSLAGDLAYSYAENQGRGFYGNFALTLGRGQLSLGLCTEIVSDLFTDPEGLCAPEGFRWGVKIVGRPSRSRTLTLEGLFRSPSFIEPVAGTEFLAAYGAAEAPRIRLPVLSSLRLSGKRDLFSELFCRDEISGTLSLRWGWMRISPFSKVKFIRSLLPGQSRPSPFPLADGGLRQAERSFGSSLLLQFGLLDLGARLERTIEARSESQWTASATASLQIWSGRLGISYTLPNTDAAWELGISFRKTVRFHFEQGASRTP